MTRREHQIREFQPYIELEADGRVVEHEISTLRDRKVWRAHMPALEQRTSLRRVTRLGPYRSLYGSSRAVARNRYLPPCVSAFRDADYEYKQLDASASQSMEQEQRASLGAGTSTMTQRGLKIAIRGM
ncbi:hypothetical protein EXIGLDRAFT_737298, partial [Exidia glandulosa HHB12029]